MILNIRRENLGINPRSNKLEITDLPYLVLERYEICVRSIYAEFDQDIPNTFVTLSTSLVDCNTLNYEREILAFNNNSFFARKIDYTPTHLAWYSLHSPINIEDGTIVFTFDNTEVKNIKKLHLQIELREYE